MVRVINIIAQLYLIVFLSKDLYQIMYNLIDVRGLDMSLNHEELIQKGLAQPGIKEIMDIFKESSDIIESGQTDLDHVYSSLVIISSNNSS
ncbi:hypothetical protein AZH53_07625 [Methanomicrobiaceae archaeon CYW5]|uniref:hypothetical protein n=1 Tax=Methanovulcanius yangii TaxID=1789227 RepID=UPI0029C9E055|nr:hypothetical protein [Methanovulcanius yangii]MBT8508272.1 hypothetical protein [Methanovulcanius yangii]